MFSIFCGFAVHSYLYSYRGFVIFVPWTLKYPPDTWNGAQTVAYERNSWSPHVYILPSGLVRTAFPTYAPDRSIRRSTQFGGAPEISKSGGPKSTFVVLMLIDGSPMYEVVFQCTRTPRGCRQPPAPMLWVGQGRSACSSSSISVLSGTLYERRK